MSSGVLAGGLMAVGLASLALTQIELREFTAARNPGRANASRRRFVNFMRGAGVQVNEDHEGFDIYLPGPAGGTGITVAPWGTWGGFIGIPSRRERALIRSLRRHLESPTTDAIDAIIWLPMATRHPFASFFPSRFGDVHVVIGDESAVLEKLGLA